MIRRVRPSTLVRLSGSSSAVLVAGWDGEAAIIGAGVGVRALEDACDGLLLEPLADVAGVGACAPGELGGVRRTRLVEGLVEAEPVPEVDAREFHGGVGGVKDALGERAGVGGARRGEGAHALLLVERVDGGCARSPCRVRAASGRPSAARPDRVRARLRFLACSTSERSADWRSGRTERRSRCPRTPARASCWPGWRCIPARTAARRWQGRCARTFRRRAPARRCAPRSTSFGAPWETPPRP